MMNLKLEAMKTVLAAGMGLFIGYILFSKAPEPKIEYKEKLVFVENKSGTIQRKINVDGSVDEIETYLAEINLQKDIDLKQTPKPQDNLFFIGSQRSAGVMFKIDHLEAGFGYDLKDREVLYLVGYSTRIF